MWTQHPRALQPESKGRGSSGPLVGQVLQAQRPTNRNHALFQGCFVDTLKKKELFIQGVFAGSMRGLGTWYG